MVEKVHHVDITRLESYCTKQWSIGTNYHHITKSDIHTFSNLTNNHQWIHQDTGVNNSPYGGMIAHGFYILTLIPGLLPKEPYEVTGHQQCIVRGSDYFRFPTPVFPGEKVFARCRLRSVQAAESSKGTILTRDVEVWSSQSNAPAVTCSLILQYF